jgi:hypothetical protein
MRRIARPALSVAFLLLLCLGAGTQARAGASVFRDRAQFEAAAQNLHTLDFETEAPTRNRDGTTSLDGIYFQNISGPPDIIQTASGNKVLLGRTAGEITLMTVFLPPGTTAVGCDQFSTPMIVSASTGESVTMGQSDGSTFVGFVSDRPIRSLTVTLDFPEPTPDVLLDNLSYGQRRAGNEPPAPQLLVTDDTGRAAALNPVTSAAEPFPVVALRNLAADDRTRVSLFVVGVLLDASDAPLVTAQAEDSQHRVFDLPVESVGRVKNLTWMSQVTVRLTDALAGAGDVSVGISVRGAVSNKATLRVN